MDADEKGPVAEALKSDFTKTVMPQVEYLLNKGYRMLMYNGQRDGSACNHLGNLNVALKLKWSGSEKFKQTSQIQVRDENKKMLGFIRGEGIFK